MDFEMPVIHAQDLDGLVQVEPAREMKEITTMNPPSVVNKRGRKKSSNQVDIKARQEKNRQSARDCRNRKKLRYQYLSDTVEQCEQAVFALREELEKYRQWCIKIDAGIIPEGLPEMLKEMNA